MIRISTKVRDEQIMALYRDGMQPKTIKQVLAIHSVWIVYKTIKRYERRKNPRR